MRVRDSVKCDADPIGAKSEHLVLVRLRIVNCFFGVHIRRERYRKTFFHQGGRLLAFRGGDEVHRPDLVVFAPAAPIIEILLPLLKLFRGDFAAAGYRLLRSARSCGQRENRDD